MTSYTVMTSRVITAYNTTREEKCNFVVISSCERALTRTLQYVRVPRWVRRVILVSAHLKWITTASELASSKGTNNVEKMGQETCNSFGPEFFFVYFPFMKKYLLLNPNTHLAAQNLMSRYQHKHTLKNHINIDPFFQDISVDHIFTHAQSHTWNSTELG